ncbi:calcium/calmodulin-dependent protein kinase type 1B-like [Penaeus monodon]|uniref:calcium/calmodulin-dependent protein kinase type 1B-like n=1 Tax=Penaeus monodon TaxID=6687 RepID=UPI0018A75FB8|nr:calcium/calmodulin-dependent protein kinase type 1B-like [Penaeus monodon]
MVLVGHYHMGVVLGRGRFGWVSRATHHIIGRPVAVKHQPWAVDGISCGGEAGEHKDCQHVEVTKCRAALENEAALLARISHPSIVALMEVVRGPSGVYVCLEDLGDTNLATLVLQRFESKNTGLSESFASTVFRQVAAGLHHLHSQGILHRDVKPENIMVIPGTKYVAPVAKLIDLGLAMAWEPSSPLNTARTCAGTVNYLAPELTLSAHNYGPEIDVFSLGASLYFTLIGETPFIEYKRNGRRGTTAVYGLQLHHEDAIDTLSRQAGVVLHAMMDTNPKTRWNLPNLLDYIWFNIPYTDLQKRKEGYIFKNKNSSERKNNSKASEFKNSSTDSEEDLGYDSRFRGSRMRSNFAHGYGPNNSGISSELSESYNSCDDVSTYNNRKQSYWVDKQCVELVSSLLKKDAEDVLHKLWEEPWGPVGGMYNLLLHAGEPPCLEHN